MHILGCDLHIAEYRSGFGSKGGNALLKLEQLSEIIQIANMGSFSEAARVLYISQPNLSRSVKQLEEELGFEIFVRKSDGVVLTE